MRRSFLSDVADELENEEKAPHDRLKPSRFSDRGTQIAEVMSDDRVEKVFLKVDPARCHMWAYHNRRYDLLNEQNCADLIDGMKTQGEQEFPAIVRRVEDNQGVDFEVICGARRHWVISWLRANNFPKFKFLIEVRELNDEEAFRLADAENRDRADISDYERACDYLGALERFYGGKQKAMADRIEVSEGWLSRYLDLGRLPAEIVDAFALVTDLRIQHGRELKPFLRNQRTKATLLECALDLKKKQKTENIEPEKVMKALKESGKPRVARSALEEYESTEGKVILSVERPGRGGLVFKFKKPVEASRDELLSACEKAIDAFKG